MEKQSSDIGGFESLKELSKGNYSAFELYTKISNTKDSDLSLRLVRYFNAPPSFMLELYKLGSESDIEKFSGMLKFYSSIPRSDFDTLRVISTDENGINAKAFLLVTNMSISEAIEKRIPISYAVGNIASEIIEEGLRGEKLYKEYEDTIAATMAMLIFVNLGSGTNPYGDLEKLGTPENSLSIINVLIKEYIDIFGPSELIRK
ncbi:MAG: hypothetical protein QW814_02345 [Methanothrix sp.]